MTQHDETQELTLGPKAEAAARGAGLKLLVYPFFFASGAAGLIYEVVWSRLLLNIFGAGLLAVTAVLTAFMAGLALGSILLGRKSDTLRFPLRFYAMIEILIGTIGLFLPEILQQTYTVDRWAYGTFGQNFAALTGVRFAVSFLILLVPATLMGATLPVLSRFLTRRAVRLGLHVGQLYAINTAGAVAGTALAGFVLIGGMGLTLTNMTAAGLNFVAAIGAFIVSTLAERAGDTLEDDVPDMPEESVEEPVRTESNTAPILLASFISGLVAMGAQVIWSRTLVFNFEFLKNTTYAFSAMLVVFLTGLAFGSALAGALVDRHPRPARLYGLILVLIGLSIATSTSVLVRGAGAGLLPSPLKGGQHLDWFMAVRNIMLQSAFVLAVPTFLMGMSFPASARAILRQGGVGRQVGRLYSINTIGGVVGPAAASFVIIPAVGLINGLLAFALVEVAAGIWVTVKASAPRGQVAALTGFAVGVIVLCAAMLPKGTGMQPVEQGQRVVYYDEGPMATVAVVENAFGYRTINIDGVGVAGTDPMLQTDQKSLAHVPALLVKDPKAALTVGFGSGGASYSFLLHDRLEKVHCCEICPQVPEAAPHLTAANHGFLESKDPRYKIIYDDARAYLGHTDQKYDIIATDCTDLRYKSNANLYDLEYFNFCRDRLNDGGVVVVWMPLAGLSDDMFRLALRTFYRVFPEMGVWFMNNEPTHYILLIGWKDRMEISLARMRERLKEEDVRADLAELHLDDPLKILSCFITGGVEAMKGYTAGEAVNTSNFPIIEFESPKYGYGDKPIIDNLASLMAVRVSPRDFIPGHELDPETLAEMTRRENALPHVMNGLAAYRQLDMEEAAREFIAANLLAERDASVRNLLEFRELRLKAATGSPWAWAMLGRVLQMQGDRDDEAADALDRASDMLSGSGGPKPGFESNLMDSVKTWHEELVEKRRRARERHQRSGVAP